MPWWHWDQRHQHQYNIQLNMLSKTLLILLQLLLQTLLPLIPPQQDPDVRSQDKTRHLRIRSRGDVGEASGMNNPPQWTPLFTTDIFVCHVHHRRIRCRDRTDSKRIWTVPERWSDPPGKQLQAADLVLCYFEWRPNAAVNVMVQRGCSCPTGTEMNRDSIASRDWCVTVGHKAQLPSASQFLLHKLLYFTIAWNTLIIICSPGLFHFCWLLDFLTSFFSPK